MKQPYPSSRNRSNHATGPAPPARTNSRISEHVYREDNDIDPDSRKAPSVASVPKEIITVDQPSVLEMPSAVSRTRFEVTEMHRLVSRTDISNDIHVDLLKSVTEIRPTVDDARVRDV